MIRRLLWIVRYEDDMALRVTAGIVLSAVTYFVAVITGTAIL